jgi:CDP-glucose 4,6-dehydratase
MSGVLVTGASGFVGNALVKSLTAEGQFVVGLARDRKRPAPLASIVVYGDVRDADFCRRVLADYKVNTVFHLAAHSIVSICAEDPVSALDVAAMGTARLLQAVREADREITVVVSTSDKVYGEAPAPYTEETPFRPRHAYEVSKACQDFVAQMFFANYGLDVRIARAVNIYGPGDPNENRIIPKTILRGLSGHPPELNPGAEKMYRQYVYIDDLLWALRAIATLGTAGETYCVGAPEGTFSALDVMRVIWAILGLGWVEPETRRREEWLREIGWQQIDDNKLRKLGWAPEVSLADGIARTVRWYREGDDAVR